MTLGPAAPRLLRAAAVGIIVLALWDPSIPSGRHGDRVVAVVSAGESGGDWDWTTRPGSDSRWADRVAHRLEDRFTVIRGPYPGADATVLAGDHLPSALSDHTLFLSPPVFLAHPDRKRAPPRPRVLHLEAPRQVSSESRIPVRAWIDAGSGGGSLRAALRVDGVVVADTILPVQEGEVAPVVVRFDLVPPRSGPLPLRIEIHREDGRDGPGPSTAADVLVNVDLGRWQVLFFDLRPSWMSTFVRRALEPDPRFALTSRTLTAPGLGTQFGAPPSSLAAAGGLDGFHAVVVGAPELLSEADATALQAFMEMRGGSVLLLLDREAPGAHDRLTGVTSWTRGGGADPVRLTPVTAGGVDLPVLEARSMIWPTRLPPGARALATTPAGDPVLWRRPVGKGRLIVSGALDNWQFRDPETTHFEPAWRDFVGEAADLAPASLEIEWIGSHEGGGGGHGGATGIVPPGGLLRFGVTLREVPEPGTRVTAVAELVAPVGGSPAGGSPAGGMAAGAGFGAMVPLWPTEVPGRFEGRVQVPVDPGTHELRLRVEAGAARLAFVVLADAAPPPPDDTALMEAWAASRGGTLRASDELADLEADILQAVGAEGPSDPWHPMRSPLWILPLALLLGGEWAWRRRRGMP